MRFIILIFTYQEFIISMNNLIFNLYGFLQIFYLFIILTLTHFGNSGAYVYPIYNIGVILTSTLVSIVFFKEKLTKNKDSVWMLITLIIFFGCRLL